MEYFRVFKVRINFLKSLCCCEYTEIIHKFITAKKRDKRKGVDTGRDTQEKKAVKGKIQEAVSAR